MPKKHLNPKQGYSILELVTVLALLSTLAGLTLPNVLRIFDFNTIDEVKTLLNNAAADCLQQSRLEPNKITYTEAIDENKSNTLGYSLDFQETRSGSSNMGAKCSFLPQSHGHKRRDSLPDYFRLPRGTDKIANRPSTDKASIQSAAVGGTMCSQQLRFTKTIASSNTANAIAQQACEALYESWTPSATGKSEYNRWNSESNSCTKTIYAFKGNVVGYHKCSQRLAEEKDSKTTTVDANGSQFPDECPGQTFWLYEGNDVGSKEALTSHSSEGKEEQCRKNREDWRTNYSNKCFKPQKGPGDCGKATYIHDENLVEMDYFLGINGFTSYQELNASPLACAAPPQSP